jgi:hypothetical protein
MCATLLDLPNEILFYIFKKLNNIDVFNSLFNINNRRIESLIREKNFSKTLNFVFIDNQTTIDQFCRSILPHIKNHVKCLIVELTSIKRILLASDYANLNELKLYNFQQENFREHLTGKIKFNLK